MKISIPDGVSPSTDPILQILQNCKSIAVVGLSSNPMRASHGVSEYLQRSGYRIVPVNPSETEVLGQKSYARLEDVPGKIDIVDIFRKAEDISPVVESAIAVGAKAVWMQLGIENESAAERARSAGLIVVQNACILIEHKKRLQDLTLQK
jgi:uncharacterized protein